MNYPLQPGAPGTDRDEAKGLCVSVSGPWLPPWVDQRAAVLVGCVESYPLQLGQVGTEGDGEHAEPTRPVRRLVPVRLRAQWLVDGQTIGTRRPGRGR